MSGRVAPLGPSLVAVSGWALALAVLLGRPELFVIAVPALLVLATLAFRGRSPEYDLAHELSRERLLEGETVTVTVTATARSPVALVELLGPVPAGASVVSGRHRAVLTLAAGETARCAYDIELPRRGLHDLGTVVARARDPWGLRTWERRHVDARLLRVYPRIAPLQSVPRPVHAHATIGDYVSANLGEGIEPGEVRQFAAGDRIRHVNWRASLRFGGLYVTERHRERSADIVLMLDTLAEVGAAPGTTLDLAVRAAGSLAAAYLGRKDRVGLISYGGLVHWVKPGTGRAQYERLAAALARASVVFTYVAKDLDVVPPRVLPVHALVVAISPLLDPRFVRAVLDLAARGFDVVVLVVSPVGVMRDALGPSRAVDLACRVWTLERRTEIAELRRQGLAVLEWNPSEPLEMALAAVPRRRARLAFVR